MRMVTIMGSLPSVRWDDGSDRADLREAQNVFYDVSGP